MSSPFPRHKILNIETLGTEAQFMSLNPFSTSFFTVLYYAFISQLFSIRASTADFLLWL
jgi:hypothetical protein